MSKDPAILFYTSDFLTGIAFMSNEQIGIYIKLLCLQHQHGGEIDKESFNNIVGDHKPIRIKFIETEDGFYNDRMMGEMIKRKKKSSSLSANALKRWEKKKEKECKSNAIASDLHMPIEDEDRDEDETINKGKENYRKIGSHVKLLDASLGGFTTQYGKSVIDLYIQKINDYLDATGKKPYKDYSAVLRNWLRKDNIKPKVKPWTPKKEEQIYKGGELKSLMKGIG